MVMPQNHFKMTKLIYSMHYARLICYYHTLHTHIWFPKKKIGKNNNSLTKVKFTIYLFASRIIITLFNSQTFIRKNKKWNEF
jgi:hypothetical protein